MSLMPSIGVLKPIPAASGPILVSYAQVASGPTLGSLHSNYPLPAVSVEAGDLIVIACQTINSFNMSGAPTDTSSNSYSIDYNNTAPTRDDERIYHAIANATNASLVPTIHNSSSAYSQVSVAVYRAPAGKTWAFDSTNFSAATNGFTGSAISHTFSTSGPGIVAVLCNSGNADGSATSGTNFQCTGATFEGGCPPNSTAGIGYFSFYADILSASALSGSSVSGNFYNSTPGDFASNKDLLIAPYTYS